MSFLAAILMVCNINCSAADDAKPEVEIHHLFKPENCARKAKMPDMLTLHYKGNLAATGEEFDSR